MIETINKQARTSGNSCRKLGREPTSEELARRMDLSLDAVCKTRRSRQQPMLRDAHGETRNPIWVIIVEDKGVVSPSDAAIHST